MKEDKMNLKKIAASALIASLACLPQAMLAKEKCTHDKGGYVAGDFHNHSTFTDGSTPTRALIEDAVGTFGLDWFAQSGHGGAYNRDGRTATKENPTYWDETVGLAGIKGDDAGISSGHQNMWRWQSLQEFQFGECRQAAVDYEKPIWVGLEWKVPGHEHCSTGIIAGQFSKHGPNADPLAQFEYLFDYQDNDASEGAGQGWSGKIENIPDGPDAGVAMHEKAVAAAKWMQRNYPFTSYMVPAHIERKGAWNKDKAYNTGWNVEHFRDLNSAAPTVCFGFEGQPGHQADSDRGGFSTGAFGGTYGGTGLYTATIGGLWDALLGEGRHWWLFASSDWHDDDDPPTGTVADFHPGQFQKDYVYVKDQQSFDAQAVLNGMRSGNSFTAMGDLVDKLLFTARGNGYGPTASMGETLRVRRGNSVVITVRFHDPVGVNHCPYNFANPSLAQMGISQPLNQPQVDHVDLICGGVTGIVSKYLENGDPNPDYTKNTNDNMQVFRVAKADMTNEGNGWYSFTRDIPTDGDFFCRLRASNLPVGTPNELDADGNPLPDTDAANVACSADNCTSGNLDHDVEAWTDLWVYSNPIFVSVK
jgi:hypothetical protein